MTKRTKSGPGGNGNRAAEQGQLELVPEDASDRMQAADASAADTPPASAGHAAAPASAPPAMRELGLTAKEMWKVDLKGKRIPLDEKGWREELARALGRTPTKG